MPYAEEIIVAVVNLVRRNGNNLEIVFNRKEIRDLLGISPHIWNYSYNPIFQGMREDQPGSAPAIAERFKNLFQRIERGRYKLTERGRHLISRMLENTQMPTQVRTRPHLNRQMRVRTRNPNIDNVNQLIQDFERYIHIFDERVPFTGPTLHFHKKTIDRLRFLGTPSTALNDELFCDYLYATLTAWYFRRGTNASLEDLNIIGNSILVQQEVIDNLHGRYLSEVNENEIEGIAQALWNIIRNLRIGTGETVLIINTKALHHLLPDLLPPIDRRYTLNFFYGRTNITRPEDRIFYEIYPLFHRIAVSITNFYNIIGQGWHTSETKLIDNAIIGFVLSELEDR